MTSLPSSAQFWHCPLHYVRPLVAPQHPVFLGVFTFCPQVISEKFEFGFLPLCIAIVSMTVCTYSIRLFMFFACTLALVLNDPMHWAQTRILMRSKISLSSIPCTAPWGRSRLCTSAASAWPALYHSIYTGKGHLNQFHTLASTWQHRLQLHFLVNCPQALVPTYLCPTQLLLKINIPRVSALMALTNPSTPLHRHRTWRSTLEIKISVYKNDYCFNLHMF